MALTFEQFGEIVTELRARQAVQEEVDGVVDVAQVVGDLEGEVFVSAHAQSGLSVPHVAASHADKLRRVEQQEEHGDQQQDVYEVTVFAGQRFRGHGAVFAAGRRTRRLIGDADVDLMAVKVGRVLIYSVVVYREYIVDIVDAARSAK